jgi:hypothetical protein
MNDKDKQQLTAELRRWAAHPIALSPRMARRRVLANLPSRMRRPAWRLVVAGAALTATALALAMTIGHRSDSIWVPPPIAETPERMIVHELSSGTKLYIVMQSHDASNES